MGCPPKAHCTEDDTAASFECPIHSSISMASRAEQSKSRNRACIRCHQSKVACDRPAAAAAANDGATCTRCVRLGTADQCELYVPKSYRPVSNYQDDGSNEEHAAKRSRITSSIDPLTNSTAADAAASGRNSNETQENALNGVSIQSPINFPFSYSPFLPSTPLPMSDPFVPSNIGVTIGPSSVALDTASAALGNERETDTGSVVGKRITSSHSIELREQSAANFTSPVALAQTRQELSNTSLFERDTFRVPSTSTSSSQLRSPYTQAQALDPSAFLQLSQLNFRDRVRSMVDRGQLTPRRLHMICSFLSEAMIESDYIQLSSLSPVPLACSLKAEFAQSPSYHFWRSQALGLLSSGNKQDVSQQSQFVMHFDFQDSPVLCVEDEESAAGMHSVSELERLAKQPQIATYTWKSLRSVQTSKSTRKEQTNSRKQASDASDPGSADFNDDSDGESKSVQLGRSKLTQLIRLRRASTAEARPSTHVDSLKRVLHVTSCPMYSKIVDLSCARITTPNTSSSAETQGTPVSNPTEGSTTSECGCPSILHYRMCAQVNREWERMFGWSQREIRDMLIQLGGRRTEHTMFKSTLPAPYEVILMEFFLSGQLDATFPVSAFTKFNTTIPSVIREHVQVTDDGDLEGITFQAYPANR